MRAAGIIGALLRFFLLLALTDGVGLGQEDEKGEGRTWLQLKQPEEAWVHGWGTRSPTAVRLLNNGPGRLSPGPPGLSLWAVGQQESRRLSGKCRRRIGFVAGHQPTQPPERTSQWLLDDLTDGMQTRNRTWREPFRRIYR